MSSTVSGLVSGLDTASIVDQLMQLEQQPRTRLQTRVDAQDKAISAYRSLSSRLRAVETAANDLRDLRTWNIGATKVSGTSVTATATAPTSARVDVNVTNTATAASWTFTQTGGLDDDLFSGGFPITVTTDSGPVSLTPPTGTMREIMSTINSAADLGVRAVAVKVSDNTYRLQVVATETGEKNTATANVTWAGNPSELTMVNGLNAVYSINGIPATSSSNTIKDAVSGLDLTLVGAGTSTVDVTTDPDKIAEKVQALVDAVNNVRGDVQTYGANKAGETKGALAGDSQVRGLPLVLAQAITDAIGGDVAGRFGVESSRDGTLTFNKTTFKAAYDGDPEAAQALFGPITGTGIAQRIGAVVTQATSTSGWLTAAIQGRETTKTDLRNQISNWDARLTLRRNALERQFTAMESALAQMQSQSSWLTSALGSN